MKTTIGPTLLVASILLVGAFSAMALRQSSKDTITNIGYTILKQLSYTDNSEILSSLWGPVPRGTIVQDIKGPVFITPDQGYVLYIDLNPMANLYHPVKYAFLTLLEQRIITFDSKYPPLNYQEYQRIDTSYSQFFYSLQNRRVPIPTTVAPQRNNDSRYAILMNGGVCPAANLVRYWNDLQYIFTTLKYVYGFPDDNIITLCSDGTDPAPDQATGQSSPLDFDNDGLPDIKYSCMLANVDYVFTSLAQNFTQNDKLFVFTTDHGSSVNGWQVDENLWNYEVLHDYHFADLLALFPSGCEKIFTMEQCFSGGFLDDGVVPPGPVVGSSACRYDEVSYGTQNGYYDEYVFHWTAAVAGHDPYGNPVDADANYDGKVTMDEAYQYAADHDSRNETPQYADYPGGAGSQLSLWVTSNPPETPNTPTGPVLCLWHENYSYSSTTTDPDGDQICYRFDWGDGSISSWLGPYDSGQPGTGYHIWTEVGVYIITAQAQDSHGKISEKSDPLVVTIRDNQPPLAPQITGRSQGKPGTSYLFHIQTTDPEDDTIWYLIDWGDNTTSDWAGPFDSGFILGMQHAWTDTGDFIVKAKAKDSWGAEGNWSTFQVKMPTLYKIPNPFLYRLLDRFLHAFPMLQHLLKY